MIYRVEKWFILYLIVNIFLQYIVSISYKCQFSEEKSTGYFMVPAYCKKSVLELKIKKRRSITLVYMIFNLSRVDRDLPEPCGLWRAMARAKTKAFDPKMLIFF